MKENALRILVINPGSTSTKLAVYENETPLFETTLQHGTAALAAHSELLEALAFRQKLIEDALAQHGIALSCLSAVIGRGGLLRPIPGGVYAVNEKMLEDLRAGTYGDHASNLGAMLALALARTADLPAFIADPVVTDELSDLARLSGHPEIERRSVFHALNQKAVAKRYCAAHGLGYDAVNLIVAHMGGGVSVGAHQQGKVVDVNDALGGEGPYSAQRCGGLPANALVKLCAVQGLTPVAMIKKLTTQGGLLGYLGTDDGREISRRAREGDEQARLFYEGMAYQIAKEIGACAAALSGQVTAILLTGGFAHDALLMDWIEQRVRFIAPVEVMPGEDELRALCEAALRALGGEEPILEY